MSRIRTVIVDDNRAFVVLSRLQLRDLHPDVEIVGEGYDGHDAVRLCAELLPQLLILDLSMPVMGGLQATRLIKVQDQPPRILIASHFGDAAHREHAAEAGADGFVDKNDFETGIADFLARYFTGATHA